MEHAQNFGPFLGQIYARKTENMAKKQNFHKNCIFRAIK